jgi:transcriptional regulator GlxA family with amidase domain
MLAGDVGGPSEEAAGQAIAGRLAEVLFIQVLRRMAAQPEPPPWLQALSDPQIGRALALVHQSPQNAWTAKTLATKAGMSRSLFFQRFQALLGETPAAYLTRWRMTVACGALQDPSTGLYEVAQAVGYASEAAFSRAFKREMGQPPSQWRAAWL